MSSFPPPPPPGGFVPPPSGPPPPPLSSPPPAPTKRKFGGLPPWGWLGIGLVAIAAVAGAIVLTNKDDDKKVSSATPTSTAPTLETVPETDESTETTEAEPTTTEADEPETTDTEPDEPNSADEVEGSPNGQRGTRDDPVPAGELADIGGGWRLQVLGFTPDAAALIEAENEFNDPPPPGSTFTMINVAMGFYGIDDPRLAFEPTVSAIGGANVELTTECGLIPDVLDAFRDIYAGGVVRGNLCFITTPADLDGLQLYGIGDFFADDLEVFLEVAQPSAPEPMPTLTGPQDGAVSTDARLDPTSVGTAVDVGEGWSLTITAPARDITDAVMAENTFNEPPPTGYRFIGIDVIYAFNGTGSDAAFTVTTSAVDDDNVQLSTNCGVIPTPVDSFLDVFAGGSVAGLICYVVPADATGLTIYASGGFDTETVWFATA